MTNMVCDTAFYHRRTRVQRTVALFHPLETACFVVSIAVDLHAGRRIHISGNRVNQDLVRLFNKSPLFGNLLLKVGTKLKRERRLCGLVTAEV